jgi:hypothetical protein
LLCSPTLSCRELAARIGSSFGQPQHGVLIANRWVVTAAHAARWGTPQQVTIEGKPRAVAALVIHPGFKMAPRELMSDDAAALMAANAA